jgi:hypothetical protein
MSSQSFEKRLERAEQAAKAEHRFSAECICFPADEEPFFGFPLEEQIAAKVKCPFTVTVSNRHSTFTCPNGAGRTRKRSAGFA